MKPAVIFDFFGVFCAPIGTNWYKKHVSDTPDGLKTAQALFTESDYGRISRTDVHKKLSEMSGMPIAEVVAGIEAETHINESLVAYVQQLKLKGYRIALLSNGTHEWTLQVIKEHGFADLFEQIVLSGDLGIVKPSPEIYLHTLRALKIEAQEALFVDDRQPNVDAAEALGMHGLLFTDTRTFQRDFERLAAAKT